MDFCIKQLRSKAQESASPNLEVLFPKMPFDFKSPSNFLISLSRKIPSALSSRATDFLSYRAVASVDDIVLCLSDDGCLLVR